MILVKNEVEWKKQLNKRPGLVGPPLMYPLVISTGPNEVVYPNHFVVSGDYYCRVNVNGVKYLALTSRIRVQEYRDVTITPVERRQVRILEGDLINQDLIVDSNKIEILPTTDNPTFIQT